MNNELKTGEDMSPNLTPQQESKLKKINDNAWNKMPKQKKDRGNKRVMQVIGQWGDFEDVLKCWIPSERKCKSECVTNEDKRQLCVSIAKLVDKYHNPNWQHEVFQCVLDGYLHSKSHKLEGCSCPAARRPFCKELINLEVKSIQSAIEKEEGRKIWND